VNRPLFFKLLLCTVAVALSLIAAELWMRQSVTPGMLWHLPWINVDSLVVYDDFETDSSGILKLSPAARRKFQKLCRSNIEQLAKEQYDVGILYLILSHCPRDLPEYIESSGALKQFSENIPSPFLGMVDSFKNGLKIPVDSVDLAYMDLMLYPINNDGFYSIPFRPYATKKKKILLLGDSFTFGYSAVPSHNSFACRLAAMGYAVFNAGISSTDPAQHAAIAKRYIEEIQPDAVFTGLYLPKDIMKRERQLKEGGYIYFSTNAIWIKGWFNGKYFKNAQQAYSYFYEKSAIPRTDENLANYLASKTAIGTKLWIAINKLRGGAEIPDPLAEEVHFYQDSLSYTEKYLLQIDSTCKANGAQCEFLVFPEWYDIELNVLKHPPYLFRKVPYRTIPGLAPSDYHTVDDYHFNNEGHRKTADYIHRLMSGSE